MALSELSGPNGAFRKNPLERCTSLRALLELATSVSRAQVRARLGRAFARPLPRRQKYSTGE